MFNDEIKVHCETRLHLNGDAVEALNRLCELCDVGRPAWYTDLKEGQALEPNRHAELVKLMECVQAIGRSLSLRRLLELNESSHGNTTEIVGYPSEDLEPGQVLINTGPIALEADKRTLLRALMPFTE